MNVLVIPPAGDKVHITRDRSKTLCGKSVDGWHHVTNEAVRNLTLYGTLSECWTCRKKNKNG